MFCKVVHLQLHVAVTLIPQDRTQPLFALAGTEALFADLGHFNRHAIQV